MFNVFFLHINLAAAAEEYEKLAENCRVFATQLLDQTRGSHELSTILNRDEDAPSSEEALSRLRLAIKYKQKAVNTTAFIVYRYLYWIFLSFFEISFRPKALRNSYSSSIPKIKGGAKFDGLKVKFCPVDKAWLLA